MKNKSKIMLSFTPCPSKKTLSEKFSRPPSYAPRLIRVCFGSNLRLRWASDWLCPRLALVKHPSKYTNNVFNLLHIFLFTVLIHVLSIVHVLLGWRNINMPGERIFLLTPSINSFYKLNSVKSWVFCKNQYSENHAAQ